MRSKLLVFVCVLTIGTIAEGQLSKAAQEWRKGPERFLLSNEEEKAWKSVKTDADAAAFIDLFWARRDPTEGTPRNEFREEFLTRVRYADRAFPEKRRRGAVTERGQVYILLGPPEAGTRDSMAIAGPTGMSAASARPSDNLVWTWSHAVAASLGVPKLTATFNQIVGSDVYARDTKKGEFSNVSEIAIRKNILHPDWKVAPEWALQVSKEALSGTPVATPKGDGKATGRIGRVVLLRDLGTLNLEAATDPLASLQPSTEFSAGGDLAFVLEYCGAEGPLKIESRINNMAAAAELEPMPITAVEGCGAIPTMLSLGSLPAGAYELSITTIEPNGARQTAKQPFTIK
ncbi:MAG TPA: GWxTD domain-containing protein [Thermoanaerobaculia bacterium]|nr:GWxTD domain-containing protein [Thermoanaerobaculia bacterium]